jgi:hypothetical protein
MKMGMNVGQRGFNEKPIELPGFRFHPTEQELVGFYLKRMVQGKLHNFNFIPMLDLYRYDPWDLSSMSFNPCRFCIVLIGPVKFTNL